MFLKFLYNRKIFIFYGFLLLGLAFFILEVHLLKKYFNDLQTTFTISAALVAFLVFIDKVNERKNISWKSEKDFIDSLHQEILLNLALLESVGEFRGRLEDSPLIFYDPTRAVFPLNRDVLIYSITQGQEYFIRKKDLLLKLVILNNDISKLNVQTKELHDFRFSNLELLSRANAYIRGKNFSDAIHDLVNCDEILKEWFYELRLRNWAIASQLPAKMKTFLYDVKCELEIHSNELDRKQPIYAI